MIINKNKISSNLYFKEGNTSNQSILAYYDIKQINSSIINQNRASSQIRQMTNLLLKSKKKQSFLERKKKLVVVETKNKKIITKIRIQNFRFKILKTRFNRKNSQLIYLSKFSQDVGTYPQDKKGVLGGPVLHTLPLSRDEYTSRGKIFYKLWLKDGLIGENYINNLTGRFAQPRNLNFFKQMKKILKLNSVSEFKRLRVTTKKRGRFLSKYFTLNLNLSNNLNSARQWPGNVLSIRKLGFSGLVSNILGKNKQFLQGINSILNLNYRLGKTSDLTIKNFFTLSENIVQQNKNLSDISINSDYLNFKSGSNHDHKNIPISSAPKAPSVKKEALASFYEEKHNMRVTELTSINAKHNSIQVKGKLIYDLKKNNGAQLKEFNTGDSWLSRDSGPSHFSLQTRGTGLTVKNLNNNLNSTPTWSTELNNTFLKLKTIFKSNNQIDLNKVSELKFNKAAGMVSQAAQENSMGLVKPKELFNKNLNYFIKDNNKTNYNSLTDLKGIKNIRSKVTLESLDFSTDSLSLTKKMDQIILSSQTKKMNLTLLNKLSASHSNKLNSGSVVTNQQKNKKINHLIQELENLSYFNKGNKLWSSLYLDKIFGLNLFLTSLREGNSGGPAKQFKNNLYLNKNMINKFNVNFFNTVQSCATTLIKSNKIDYTEFMKDDLPKKPSIILALSNYITNPNKIRVKGPALASTYFTWKTGNSVYQILTYVFERMNCLISKPYFYESPNQITIQLFYYSNKIDLSTKLALSKESNSKKTQIPAFPKNGKNPEESNAEQVLGTILNSSINSESLNYGSDVKELKFIKLPLNKAITPSPSGMGTVAWNNPSNLLLNENINNQEQRKGVLNSLALHPITLDKSHLKPLSNLSGSRPSFLIKNKDKFKELNLLLSKLFNKTVVLDLTRLKRAYYDVNILTQMFDKNTLKRRNKVISLISLLYSTLSTKFDWDYSGTNSISFSKNKVKSKETQANGSLRGFNIKVGGRLLSQKIIPRISSKTYFRGKLARGKIHFVNMARIFNKHKRGAYSFTISTASIVL